MSRSQLGKMLLTDQVYFVYQAFLILTALVKNHVQKSIRKNGKLTDQVYFVYQAFFILTELAQISLHKLHSSEIS